MLNKADFDVFTAAMKNGWAVEPMSLYDEEGVDGWLWTSPEGNEYTEVAFSSNPAEDMPEVLYKLYKTA